MTEEEYQAILGQVAQTQQWANPVNSLNTILPSAPTAYTPVSMMTATELQMKYPSPIKDNEMILTAKEGFKFGCDPELFVFDPDGNPVPAEMIPGSKAEPHKVDFGAVQRDGMAAEFNIDPVRTFKEFNRNIEAVMKQLEGFLPNGYTMKAVPMVRFAPEVFDAASDDAKELGCMPDFNAWTGDMNPPPRDPDDPYLRTASGHLHIGWTENMDLSDNQHIMNCCDLVKQFDWYLGGWSTKMDSDPTRRKLYGRAGACRFKEYGVEYRVLSNFWITTRDRRLAVWNRMQAGIDAMRRTFMPDVVVASHNTMLQYGINAGVVSPELMQGYRHPLQTIA